MRLVKWFKLKNSEMPEKIKTPFATIAGKTYCPFCKKEINNSRRRVHSNSKKHKSLVAKFIKTNKDSNALMDNKPEMFMLAIFIVAMSTLTLWMEQQNKEGKKNKNKTRRGK